MNRIDKLLLLMAQEKELYKRLLPLAEEKHDSLRQRDLQRLDEVVKKEQGVLFETKLVQRKREEALREVASETQLPEGEVSLRALADKMPEKRDEILALRDEFAAIVDAYGRQTEINRRILEDELDYVGFMLNYITPEGTAANNYDQAGNTGLESVQRTGLFDQKV